MYKIVIIILVVFLIIKEIEIVLIKKQVFHMKKMSDRNQKLFFLTNNWLYLHISGKSVAEKLAKKGYRKIAVYGMGELGLRLTEEIRQIKELELVYGIDIRARELAIVVPTFTIDNLPYTELVDVVVITTMMQERKIEEDIKKYLDCDVVLIQDLINTF